MPKQMKETYPIGTPVMFTYCWYGRTHKHDYHPCIVVNQWVKVAGRKPRNYYKYRLECLECGTEFNAEDGTTESLIPVVKWMADWRRNNVYGQHQNP